jgi:hypothetical protein
MCELFANPFGGVSTDILKMHGTMSQGSHRFFLFNLDSTSAQLYTAGKASPCPGAGLEFHPFPFFSQQPDWTVSYPNAPDGSPMGYPLAGPDSVMIFVSYLNTSSVAISPTVQITLTPAKAGVVTTHVGSIFLNQTSMTIPTTATMANPVISSKSWTGSPNSPSSDGSYYIFSSWSHMHEWALDFQASTNNQVFYEEKNWDAPGLFWHLPGFGPNPTTATGSAMPVHMPASGTISWQCSYYNDTGMTLTFGDSANKSVMCIYIGQYYPANAASPDVIAAVN